MVQKSLGYVELEWECPSCKTRNPGSQRTCAQCGAPHPDDVQFVQAAQEKIITDEKAIAAAQAGPDVHCAYCGARNPATARNCKQCGADLAEGKARAAGQVLGGLRTEAAPPLICPTCGAANSATARKCSQCGAALVQPKPATAPPRPAAQKSSCGILLLVLVGIVALVGVFLLLRSRTSELVGQVSDVNWRRTIAVEALMPVTRESWRDEIPSDVQVGQCVKRVHHTQDQPEPGAKEVCGTPYVVDQGSGYGKVVQDCRYEVYADWCQYKTTDWVLVDPLIAEGQDLNPVWPAAPAQKDRRPGARQEQYVVTFIANDKTYQYRVASAEEFARYTVGSRWRLSVNTFGAVTSVEPAQ
jgi:ribosomal protein L40E